MNDCLSCGRQITELEEGACFVCERPRREKKKRKRGPVDVATFIQENMNPTTDGRESLEGFPLKLRRGTDHYKELSEAPVKVDPRATALPMFPPGDPRNVKIETKKEEQS